MAGAIFTNDGIAGEVEATERQARKEINRKRLASSEPFSLT
jgi:hypothetical protein